jgi:hypothetical protein
MHWCADETAALVGAFSSLGLVWAWLKNKYNAWLARRLAEASRCEACNTKICPVCRFCGRTCGCGVVDEHTECNKEKTMTSSITTLQVCMSRVPPARREVLQAAYTKARDEGLNDTQSSDRVLELLTEPERAAGEPKSKK